MTTPNLDCKIEVYCSLCPSEDPQKVKHSVSNLFADIKIKHSQDSIKADSKNIADLEKIQQTIHSRNSQKTYRRNLTKNLINDTTWFYLNKQAAFVGTVALCEEAEESPLGPIKVFLQSKNIETIIDWLVS